MVKSGLVAKSRAQLLRNAKTVPSLQPTSWRKSRHKSSALASAVKTPRRVHSKPFFINRELDEIQAVLPQVVAHLNIGGRLAVIAFHSLEDRLVKQFIRTHSTHAPLPKWAAIRETDLPQPPLLAVGKAIKPSDDEIAHNPRARSAVLRIAERTHGIFQAA